MLTYYLITTITFFLLGATFLSLFTVWVYRSGAVHRSRHYDGTMNTKSDWQGKVLSFLFLAIVIILLVIYDKTINCQQTLNFWQLSLANFTLMFILTLFDSFIIDLLVLARWKPAFLKIPDEVTVESMRLHVKKTFQLGWVIILVLSFLSSGIYLILSLTN
ncbi:MAG: hypothetical protein JEZ00_21230 [Anaerolineaceae bacterium]|nr:hypothetical protein [Anaerolineaceae bacterium]